MFSSSSSQHAAKKEFNCLPHSQPMQRSIQLVPYPKADNMPSRSFDEEFSFTSTIVMKATLSYEESSPTIRGLHYPLHAHDPRLLGMPPLPHVFPLGAHKIGLAEMLAASITDDDLEGKHFTKSYGIDEGRHFDTYHYQSGEELTVLAMWCIIKRAELPPVDTFVLASLILQELDERFYDKWTIQMTVSQQGPDGDRIRDLIIVAACVPYSFPLLPR
jgi:hypothetical protein